MVINKLKSQLNKNIASGALVHGLNIFIGLISYPIFINYLGFELFSVWTLLSIIISFAQLGDFGISKAVIFYTSKESANKNFEKIKDLLSTALFVLFILALIIQGVLWVGKSQIIDLLAVPEEFYSQSLDVLPLIGIAVFSFLVYDCLLGIITGLGRLDFSNLLLLTVNLLKIGFTVLLLSFKPTVVSMALGVIISNLFMIFIVFVIISKTYYNSSIPLSHISKKISIQILKYGLPVLGIQTLNMLMFPVVKIIMANNLGVVSVGVFELATKVAYSIRTFFEKGLFALMPEFSMLHDLNDRGSNEVLQKKVRFFTKKLMYLGVPIFVLAALCSPFVLKLWLNTAYNPEILHGYLLLQPGIIVGLLALPSYYALLATKNQKICFYEAVIRTITTIFIILVMFLFLPLSSVLIYTAITLSVVFSNFYLMYSFRNRMKHV